MSKRITGMQRYEHGFRDKKKSIKKNGKKMEKKWKKKKTIYESRRIIKSLK